MAIHTQNVSTKTLNSDGRFVFADGISKNHTKNSL